tara:strand:- start:1279 stop:1566 length:288 start_codon:yes stop_codon:yes gene_type:complete
MLYSITLVIIYFYEMGKLFKWFLYIATTISIFMSIFSLVADETVTKSYDFEAGEEIILSTADCPCWEVAIPFMIISIIGVGLIIKIRINNKKSKS